jgi:hypothetical protein
MMETFPASDEIVGFDQPFTELFVSVFFFFFKFEVREHYMALALNTAF